jgi:hypothetical protein
MPSTDFISGNVASTGTVTLYNRHANGHQAPPVGMSAIIQNGQRRSWLPLMFRLIQYVLTDTPDVNALQVISGNVTNGFTTFVFTRQRVTSGYSFCFCSCLSTALIDLPALGSPAVDYDLGPSCLSYTILLAQGTSTFNEHSSPGSTNGP